MVLVIEKRSNWMSVAYLEVDGKVVIGWVSERYLEKLTK